MLAAGAGIDEAVQPEQGFLDRCRVEGLSSAVLLAAHFALHGPAAEAAELQPRLIAALTPWAMTHHHALRTFALLALQVRPSWLLSSVTAVAGVLEHHSKRCSAAASAISGAGNSSNHA